METREDQSNIKIKLIKDIRYNFINNLINQKGDMYKSLKLKFKNLSNLIRCQTPTLYKSFLKNTCL